MQDIQYIKLSDLARQVETVIKQSFGGLYWIVAEISGHKFYPNNDRHYFEFVEKAEGFDAPVAKVNGRAWYAGAQSIRLFEKETGQQFTNGLQVLVQVRIEYHTAHGFALILQDIDQSFTLGNLEKLRRETLLRLVAENPDAIQKVGDDYITKNKKLKVGAVIQNIAIIGSPNSEGYTDFTHTISNNQFAYKFSIDIYQSSVQGAEAEKELINKLISIYQSQKKYDCVVIIRGGGAKTDFLVFDSYGLSRAAAKFPIPIITGLGHHKDVSIIDLMVNTSTKTPTKAAEFIISHNRTFEDQVLTMQKAIIIKSQQLLGLSQQSINTLNVSIINKTRNRINSNKDQIVNFNQTVINKTKTILYAKQTSLISLFGQITSRPLMIMNNRSKDLAHITSNLKVFSGKYLANKSGFLGHYISIIRVLSPDSTLKRGFAVISHKGKIVKNADQITIGSPLTITLSDAEINTTVTSKNKRNGTTNV